MKRASLAVALAVTLGCGESARFVSWTVARAPHPPWAGQAGPSSSSTGAAFSSDRPGLTPSAPFDLPPIRAATLNNGVRVFTIERHTLPVAAVCVLVGRGAFGAPPGVASLAAATLLEGTPWSSSLAIHQRFAEMGALVSTTASYDAVRIDVKVPAPNLGPALEVVGDILRAPTFPAERVEIVKSRFLADRAIRESRPQSVAATELDTLLYPPGHPYREPADGGADAIRKVGRDDLDRFWQSAAVPRLTSIIVAGDIDDGSTLGTLRRIFDNGSPGTVPVLPGLPPAVAAKGPRIVLVNRAADPQCVVRIGWLVADRDSEDVPALRMLVGTLARGTLGRLGHLLRVERSETYGVQAMLVPRVGASEFIVTASIERDRTADALRESLAEIERLRTDVVSRSELPSARALLGDSTWQWFETSSDVVNMLTDPVVHRDPIDKVRSRLLAPASAGPEQVRQVAARYLTSEARRIVVVGDVASVRAPIEALGLGEIVLR